MAVSDTRRGLWRARTAETARSTTGTLKAPILHNLQWGIPCQPSRANHPPPTPNTASTLAKTAASAFRQRSSWNTSEVLDYWTVDFTSVRPPRELTDLVLRCSPSGQARTIIEWEQEASSGE